jgi:hypothetical protein
MRERDKVYEEVMRKAGREAPRLYAVLRQRGLGCVTPYYASGFLQGSD